MKCAARGSLKIQDTRSRHFDTIAQLCRAVSSQLRRVSTMEKIVKQQYHPMCPRNMVNSGPLMAEICWRVWGTPANLNEFRV